MLASIDDVRWTIPSGQRFSFADFDDGIVMFDGRVGSTHLLNVTAAEALSIIEDLPRATAMQIHRALLERLELDAEALPVGTVVELLWQLENLGLVAATA